MNLLAIIVVFFLMQHWSGARSLQSDSWLSAWSDWAQPKLQRLKMPIEVATVLIIVLPALAATIVLYVIGDWFFGLLGLVLLVGLLLYALGRGDFNGQVQSYLTAWRNQDFQAAYLEARKFSHGEILDETEKPADLHCHTVQAVLYQGFERWFAVVFWFIALGPFGALVYRISFLLANEHGIPDKYCNTMVCRVIYWLEWLPVRLFGFSVAIVGDFGSSFKVWRQLLNHDDVSTEQRLMRYGLSALGENTQLACQDGDCENLDVDALVVQGASQMEAIRTLLNRTVVLSVVVIALIAIFA